MTPSPSFVAGKARDALVFERALVRSRELTVSERARLSISRYAAVARDRGSVRYLGRTLHYDNRLTPVLLPGYLEEIRRLDAFVHFASARSVIDVGANIGQFAATVAWRFPHVDVWSFEPNAAVIALLEANAAQSERWHVQPYGIAEHDAEVEFWFVPGKSSQGSVFRDNATALLARNDAIATTAQVRALHAQLATSLGIPGTVDLVKVDVEGAEESALRGLAHVRWRHLAIETSLARSGGLALDDVLALCEELWGSRPDVSWAARPQRGAVARDVILSAPRRT